MTNLEYYKKKEIARCAYDYYQEWGVSFAEWLKQEWVSEMPTIFGNYECPFYTATYKLAEHMYEFERKKNENHPKRQTT